MNTKNIDPDRIKELYQTVFVSDSLWTAIVQKKKKYKEINQEIQTKLNVYIPESKSSDWWMAGGVVLSGLFLQQLSKKIRKTLKKSNDITSDVNNSTNNNGYSPKYS